MSREPPREWDAVFFDIGGVIVSLPSVRRGYAEFVTDWASERGMDPEAALEEWRSVLGAHFKARSGSEYRTASEGYRKAFGALADGDLDESEWLPGFRAATRETLEPNPGAVEAIEALDEGGYHLGVVSDIDTWEAERMLDIFGIEACFDRVTTSEAVGHTKPDARMFEAALEGTEVDPARSLMIGDRADHDMQGGRDAGLWTVAYGGTAAESVSNRDGHRALGDGPADFVVDDLREILDIVGAR